MATITAAAAGGNWTNAATWTGGAVPTGSDDVLLASTSGDVTINAAAACRSLDCSGYTGTLTHNTFTLTVGSSTAAASGIAVKLVPGMTYTASATGAAFVFTGSYSGTLDVDFAGKSTGNVTYGVGSSLPTWRLTGTHVQGFTNAVITHTIGGLDTNGQTCTWGQYSSSNTNTRSLSLGASQITMIGTGGNTWTWATSGNLTFTAGTATITFTGTNPTLSGAGKTFPSVVFTSTTPTLGGNASLTFANLTWTPPSTWGNSITFNSSFTVTGNLTLTGPSRTYQGNVVSQTNGVARTITVNGTVSLTNTDLRDVTAAGSASWDFSAQNDVGDVGGNTNITFPAAQTIYRVGESSATSNFSDAKWATTQGGVAGTARVPLTQDTARWIGSTGGGNVGTVIDVPRVGTVDWSGPTGNITNPLPSTALGSIGVAGSWITEKTFTSNPAQQITFIGRGNYTLTEFSTHTAAVTVAAPGGTLTLGRLLTVNQSSTAAFTLSDGTLALDIYAVLLTGAASRFNKNGGTFNMGAGVVQLNGTAANGIPWQYTGGTVNAGTSAIVYGPSANARTFQGGGQTYNILRYTAPTATGSLTINGSNTFDSIEFSDASNARTLIFANGSTTTFTGAGIVGSGATGRLLTLTDPGGSPKPVLTKASGTVTLDYWAISNSTATGGATWQASHATDGGGNTGWLFLGNLVDGAAITLTGESDFAGAGTGLFDSSLMDFAGASDLSGAGVTLLGVPLIDLNADSAFTGAGSTLLGGPLTTLSGDSTFTGSGTVIYGISLVTLSGDSNFAGAGDLIVALVYVTTEPPLTAEAIATAQAVAADMGASIVAIVPVGTAEALTATTVSIPSNAATLDVVPSTETLDAA
jgi:hypothetical protein